MANRNSPTDDGGRMRSIIEHVPVSLSKPANRKQRRALAKSNRIDKKQTK